MPAFLHEPAVRDALKQRVARLRPDATRRWGQMTVDQMLWHVNSGLESSLGRFAVKEQRLPLPNAVVKFLVFNLPWRRGKTPTAPEFVARDRYDFERERERLLGLIDEVTAKPVDSPWPASSFMGPMSGRDWMRMHARHLDHHLAQFGE